MSYTRSIEGAARLQRLAAKCAWLDEWREAGGGKMPQAVKRATEDGPIIAVRWSPEGAWEPVGQRRAA